MQFKRSHSRAAGGAIACALFGLIVAAANAAPRQLPTIPNPGVNPTRLVPGGVYGAHLFPLPLHVEENFGLPADQFPDFLATADALLNSLRSS